MDELRALIHQEVIAIFNDRFFVPFKLEVKNRVSVILGNEPVLTLGFIFEDGSDSASVDKATLLQTLSMGEKKALYILNIIFEIEVRKKSKHETLLIVDDIADSFDYRNKYAIIQYLKDIAEEPNFKQIILTHNFDFFRTANSRFIAYSQCLMASKTATGITLERATGIQNVFVNDWKHNINKDPKKRIASIPFTRNLIEFAKGEKDADFLKLTSLLHWRTDSASITQRDLDDIFNRTFGTNDTSPDGAKLVVDLIQNEAAQCLTASASANFEHKIVLSIAIRLAAEKFMVEKIKDPTFVASITRIQTQKLLEKFRKVLPTELVTIKVLDRVGLMTPENIHLNSFMYEPILDMSDEHLRKLYREVLALK